MSIDVPAVVGEFLQWVDQGQRHDAVMLLEQLEFPDGDVLAIALARALHNRPPTSATRTMTRLAALGLAVTLINADVVPADIVLPNVRRFGEALDRAHHRLLGVYDTPHQAALAAIRRLGGADKLGMPPQAETDLGDTTTLAAQQTLDLVEQHLENDHHWLIRHAYGFGFVLLDITES